MSATPARRSKLRTAPIAVVVTPEGVAADVLNLLAGIERVGAAAPAAIAFRMAISRKGRELATGCGEAALAEAFAQVRAADAERADAREAIISAAWAGLPECKS